LNYVSLLLLLLLVALLLLPLLLIVLIVVLTDVMYMVHALIQPLMSRPREQTIVIVYATIITEGVEELAPQVAHA
jgi:hypothetical protein